MAQDQPDPLQELRDAAQRARDRIPRDGYATSGENRAAADEVEAIAALLRTLRDLVPPELQHQVTETLRQVLLLLRSLIDWWVARLGEAPRAESISPDVEEIRVD
jgi:hypothetical protein